MSEDSNPIRRQPHILCVDLSNSDRSQMAEGYLRALAGELVQVKSGGMQHMPLHRYTVQVMQEDGVDIRRHSEKLVSRDLLLWADIVITISGPTESVNPPVPSSAVEKRWMIAPPTEGDDPLSPYRHTRDEVKRRVQQLVNALKLSRSSAA